MRCFWNRLNYFTHTQVFLRVIPVVFVTVLAVGAFSWIVFVSNISESVANHQQQDLAAFEGNLRHQVSLEAMTLESWKEASWDEIGSGKGWQPHQLQAARHSWLRNLTRFPLIGAVALVSDSEQSELKSRLAFTDSLNSAANHRILDDWVQEHQALLRTDIDLDSWCRTNGPGNLVPTTSDFFHSTFLLPPILVQVTDVGSPRTGRASRHALLPVLVRESGMESSGRSAARSDPRHSVDNWDEENTHAVYFVDLATLIQGVPLEGWWCVLGHDDLVMSSLSGLPYAGIRLQDQPELGDVGIFSAMSGAELTNWMESSWVGVDYRLSGWRDTPWLVTAARAQNLPMTLLIARPAEHLKAMTVRYALAILAVALVALLGSFVGIAKVMEPFSRRLSAMSENMESLAGGDFSIRMAQGKANEVERLVGHFNIMAGSLDETNQELAEKTLRLSSALKNLRALDKAKDEFLVLISHEVRTPLTAIMGGIDYLKSTVGRCEESIREVLESMNVSEITEIMDHSAGRLRDFMNDAIQMISIQNSERQLKLYPVPAGDFLSACLAGVQQKADGRGLRLDNELAGVAQWDLLCDVEVLRVALGRILDNAVAHNEDGGHIRVAEASEILGRGRAEELLTGAGKRRLLQHITSGQWASEDICWRLLEIFNTGPAIPPHRQEALFSKFQVVGDIEHHQKGSGLSLPIALAAIEHHGGAIFIESEEGVGNSFYLLLPTVPSQWPELANGEFGSRHEKGQSVGGGSGNEKVGQVADAAGLKVELNHPGASLPSSADQSGSGVNSPGRTYDEEKVTVRS